MALALGSVQGLPAATLTVTTVADSGPGSLRQCIAEALSGDSITFSVTGLIRVQGSPGPDAAEFMIRKDLLISGPGPDKLVLTYPARIRPNFLTASSAAVTLSGLCIARDATLTSEVGGTLTFSNCVLRGARVQNYAGCAVLLVNSQVADSTLPLQNLGGYFGISGSSVFNNQTGFITASGAGTNIFFNSTFARNGAGLSLSRGQSFFTNCTIAVNSTSGVSAGAYGSAHLFNTIIAGNAVSDCGGSFDSLDYNLIGKTNGCIITNLTSHNLYGLDPRLGSLGDCGGPTPTIPPASGSPAIDAGATVGAPLVDQRGRPRPFGTASDIGAVESCPPYLLAGEISGFTRRGEMQIQLNSTNAISTESGQFRVFGLVPGSYIVAPADAGYLFLPLSRSIEFDADCTDVNFKAYQCNCISFEGFSSNAINLAFAGAEGQVVELLGSGNLADWVPLSTNTVPPSRLLELTSPLSSGVNLFRTANR